ncbi:uncharacterized protein LOC127765869 [Oryza glaberrima]|uniref:DUF7595 domain-containing protein n=1 Tax=Oryza glaberrima TaxID=4538 RepID=I1PG06_ORYGL|nr:uncharacterized protein LOC127765869 [Oryza glaberrima]
MASTILPDDLMPEIAVRSDIVSIVRCAATCKSLRGRILEEEFCCRHNNAATSLLRGVSYRFRCDLNTFVGVTQAASSPSSSPLPRFDAGILNTFEPMVSRDGLVVVLEDYVYAGPDRFNMCVCNTITGDVTSLPAMDPAMKVKRRLIYPPALLDVGDAGRSFELLVADNELHTQTFTFSSKDGGGGWGAARTIRMDAGHRKPSIPMPFHHVPGRRRARRALARRHGAVLGAPSPRRGHLLPARRRGVRRDDGATAGLRRQDAGLQEGQPSAHARRVAGRHGVEPGRGGARADLGVDVGGRIIGGGDDNGGEVEPAGGDHEAGDRPERGSRENVQQRLLRGVRGEERCRALALASFWARAAQPGDERGARCAPR